MGWTITQEWGETLGSRVGLDQEGCHMDQKGPGGTLSWGQEGHGCRTRRDIVAQGREGLGKTRKDIIVRPGGTKGGQEDQEDIIAQD